MEYMQNITRRYPKAKFAMAKIDIEGSEYDVLQSLYENMFLTREHGFDTITIEYHSPGRKWNFPLTSVSDTEILELDNEEYTRDGRPLCDNHFEQPQGQVDAECRKIYLDLGANIGMHARFLFEPKLYQPRQTLSRMLELFDRKFGPASIREKPSSISGICVFGLEANPAQSKRLAELNSCYRSKGWAVNYESATAVSTKWSNLTLEVLDGVGVGTASSVKIKN